MKLENLQNTNAEKLKQLETYGLELNTTPLLKLRIDLLESVVITTEQQQELNLRYEEQVGELLDDILTAVREAQLTQGTNNGPTQTN